MLLKIKIIIAVIKKIGFNNLNVSFNELGKIAVMYEHKEIKPKKRLRGFSEASNEHKNSLRNYLEKTEKFLEVFHRVISRFHTINIHNFFGKITFGGIAYEV